MRSSSLGTLLEMVAGGVGATLLPAMAAPVVRRMRGRVVLVPFGDPAPGRTIALAYRPTSAQRPLFDALVPLLADL